MRQPTTSEQGSSHIYHQVLSSSLCHLAYQVVRNEYSLWWWFSGCEWWDGDGKRLEASLCKSTESLDWTPHPHSHCRALPGTMSTLSTDMKVRVRTCCMLGLRALVATSDLTLLVSGSVDRLYLEQSWGVRHYWNNLGCWNCCCRLLLNISPWKLLRSWKPSRLRYLDIYST